LYRHFEIIMNPIAGAGEAELLVESVAAELGGEGHDVRVFRTTGPGDARRRAAQMVVPQVDAVLVAGGDGTISETIAGLLEDAAGAARPPLAILPIGTENLLGRCIGAKASVVQAELTLLHGRVMEFDVPRLERPPDRGDEWDAGPGPRCGIGHFMSIAGMGFDAEVVHRLARTRAGNINYANYLAPIASTLYRYRFPTVRVEVEGEVVCQEPAMVFIGNVPRYALGLSICRDARVDDGLLDLVVFKCRNYFDLIEHSFWTLLRRHVGRKRVVYRQVRQVDVRSCQPVALQVDGDDLGSLPARFSMVGQRVRLLAPPRR
jgi:YegS/Rv2252/BmrU family lipid kinase